MSFATTDENGYRWVVVAYTTLFQALSFGVLFYSMALFVVPMATELDVEQSWIMLAFLAFQIVNGALSPLVGVAYDRLPARHLLGCGAACLGLGLAFVSSADSFAMLAIAFSTLLPMGFVLCGPVASQTLVSRWVQDRRGLALGVSAMGTSLGGFVLPPVAALLLVALGWRETLLSFGALTALAIGPLAYILLRRASPAPMATDDSGSASSGTPEGVSTRVLLRHAQFWIPVLALTPLSFAFTGVQLNIASYLLEHGLGTAMAATAISTMSIAMVAGKLGFGAACDVLDHRVVYWCVASLVAGALLLLLNANSAALVLAATGMMGLGIGGVLPLIGAIYSSLFGARSLGRVLGLATVFMTSAATGPYFASRVYEITGSYDIALVAFVLLLGPGAVAIYWLQTRAAPTWAPRRSGG